MKKVLKKIWQYKYLILTNLLIFLSYIIIACNTKLYGIDDTLAHTNNLNGSVLVNLFNNTINRAQSWNARFGEMLTFTLGALPRYVFFIITGLGIIIFINLVYIYTYGKKALTLKLKWHYYISILISYVLLLTLFPAFSEVIIWMTGACNHLWGCIIALLAALPFRLSFEDKNLLKNHTKLELLFYILCFIASFNIENIVPWLIRYMGITLLYHIIKKTSKRWMYISLAISIIGYSIFVFSKSTLTRIDFFKDMEWAIASKNTAVLRAIYHYRYIILLILFLGFIVYLYRFFKDKKKEINNNDNNIICQAATAGISIIVLHLAPYYVVRATTLLFFFSLTVIIYFTNWILEYIFKHKTFINLTITSCIIILSIMTVRLHTFYNDYNKFNELRINDIQKQYNEGKNELICYHYDNKKNYMNIDRLNSLDHLICDITYVRYIVQNDNITVKVSDSYKR